MYRIVRYRPDAEKEWNDFVRKSVNGTFLLDRRYMDYHADRFEDFSLMVFWNDQLFALLPGNRMGDSWMSHMGLTYGGIVMLATATTPQICMSFEEICRYLKNCGIKKVVYKAIPWIYHKYPSEQDLFAVCNICNAHLSVRHISSTIDLLHPIPMIESRKSGIRKAKAKGVVVRKCGIDEIPVFWDLLASNLHGKYNAKPVHQAEELVLLMSRFPSNIQLYASYIGERMVGGALLYVTETVVHTQYISASEEGKMSGALDILFDTLFNMDWHPCRYFDFGKSSDGDGHDLNESLIFQKEGFGGRGICYDWYEWTL